MNKIFYPVSTIQKWRSLRLVYFQEGLYTQRQQVVYQIESNALALPVSVH